MDEGFRVERYALGVYNEISMALEGLVEEEQVNVRQARVTVTVVTINF
jgi:hypothetical protein